MISLADLANKTGYCDPVVSRALNSNPDKHSNVAEKTASAFASRPRGRPQAESRRLLPQAGIKRDHRWFLPMNDRDLITKVIDGISSVLAEENFPYEIALRR